VTRVKEIESLASEYEGETEWVPELIAFDPRELLYAARSR